MRKGFFVRTAALALAVVFLGLLASCATVVQVRDHIPSKINMSGIKSLAISPIDVVDGVRQSIPPMARTVSTGDGADQVKVFSSYSPFLCSQLGAELQGRLLDGLGRTGRFALVPPEETRRLFSEGSMLGSARKRFMEAGVDAILSSRLSLLSYDEFITSENRPVQPEAGKTVTDYYLNTSSVLVYDYRIVDVERNCLVASGSRDKKIEERSLVATYEKKADGTGGFAFSAPGAPSLERLFREAADEIADGIPDDMVPRWEYSYETLMEGDETDEQALALAGAGDIGAAFAYFDGKWRASGGLPAGYNAAILLYAQGRLSDAVLYMREVAERTGSPQARGKLAELEDKRRLESIAERQLGDERPDATVEEFEIRQFFGL